MKNCKGIFGKIFGHSFESMAHKKYKIICKRCGVEK